jgi:protease IV
VLGAAQSSPLDPGNKAAASTTIRRALDKAAADDSIKGVVLRVDSPGGSATASEIILNATKRVKAKKPLAVSMGDVAGSGGYYVACGSDTIFADEMTITGSIGVVGGKLATSDMFGKIGVKFKEYTRGANADLLSGAHSFTTEQRKIVQTWMDEIYDVFKQHVVDIRKERLKKPIDDIAGGRVYTGRQAVDLGLVDKIGTLDDAIKFVAKEAKVDKYEVRVVPEPKNLLQLLMGGKADEEEEEEASVSGAAATRGQATLLAAALPYLQNLDRPHVDAVVRALRQLETLQREGVVLMTPELLLESQK